MPFEMNKNDCSIQDYTIREIREICSENKHTDDCKNCQFYNSEEEGDFKCDILSMVAVRATYRTGDNYILRSPYLWTKQEKFKM